VEVKYASVKNWMAMTGLSETTTYRLLSRGKIRSIKIGRATRIDVPHSLEYLASLASDQGVRNAA